MSTAVQLLPRIIRLRDAPGYLGMDRNRFNKEVRPRITEIPIGEQGIAFDRLELEDWVEHYISCNGRPRTNPGGKQSWDAKQRQDSTNVVVSGTSTRRSEETDFAKALVQATSKKQKTT